jgi:hypothetical protein
LFCDFAELAGEFRVDLGALKAAGLGSMFERLGVRASGGVAARRLRVELPPQGSRPVLRRLASLKFVLRLSPSSK